MSSLTQHSGFASGRMVLLFGIFGAHALLIWAISSGIATPVIDRLPGVLKVVFPVDETVVEPLPQPRPVVREPTFADPIRPDFEIVGPAETGGGAITAGEAISPPDTRPVIEPQPKIVPLQYQQVRSPDEFYPPTAQRLQEQGIAEVEACVGANGRLDGVPVVRKSSGFARLDEAAILYAQQGMRFKPATSGGAPVRSCKGFRVNFQLH